MTDYRQNQTLFQQYQVSRDRKTRDLLFKINENLIHSVISKMTRFGWDYDDFYQEGSIGLLKAIDRFDPDHGAAFSSLAMPYIRGSVLHYIRDKFGLVSAPRDLYELYRKGEKFIATHRQNTGVCPSESAIVKHLGTTSDQWRDAVFANAKPESLDVLLPESDRPRMDYLESPEKPGIPMLEIEGLLNVLDDRSKHIVREYYLKDRSDRSISKDIGKPAQSIGRWRKRAIRTIQRSIGNPPRN